MVAESGKNAKQREEFEKAARLLGVDESDDALDEIMRKLDLKKKPEASTKPERK